MKIVKKNIPTIVVFSIIGILVGSFTWEILERILFLITKRSDFSLTIKESIQIFDIYVLSLSFRANPGTLLGFLGSILIIRKI